MEYFEDIGAFVQLIQQDMERGKRYEWECPLCGGIVSGVRAEYNGHLHAGCDRCGVRIME